MRQGNWKLRWQWKPYGTGQWELFDLTLDPGERQDLASERPEKVVALVEHWEDYVTRNNVILPSRSLFETLDDNMPQRFPDEPGYPPLLNKRQFIPPPEMVKEPN